MKNSPINRIKSLDSLIRFIDKNSSNDYDRALGAYYWVATHIKYHLRKALKGKSSYNKPQDIFKKRKAVCQGYANIYQYMCSKMNLKCHVVIGYSKGFSYYVGQPFYHSDHAWNAVWIDSSWHLVDPTWGAGVVKKKLFYHKFIRRYTKDYFIVSPNEFVHKHLPDAPMWQLLTNPISLKIFSEGDKAIEKHRNSKPPFYFNFNDTISFYRQHDSTEQTLIRGQMALEFNPYNTTPLVYAIINALVDHLQKNHSFDYKDTMNLIYVDSLIQKATFSNKLLKKAKCEDKSFELQIAKASRKACEISGALYAVKGRIIEKSVNQNSLRSFDSLVIYANALLKAQESSVLEYRNAIHQHSLNLMENVLFDSYEKIFQQYKDFLSDTQILPEQKKKVQHEISLLKNRAFRTFPKTSSYNKQLYESFK